MLGFRRKKHVPTSGTSDNFVEATGGGWGETPDIMPADGGSQADYVGECLRKARAYAEEHGIEIGKQFEFKLTDIPNGIASPHEIVFGVMMRGSEYGLSVDAAHNETFYMTRIS